MVQYSVDIPGQPPFQAFEGQLGSAAEKFKDREQHVSSRLEEQISILKQELDQEKTKTTQFHSIVLEKDATISRLESKLNSQTPVHPEVPSPPEPSYSRESSSAKACGSSLTDSGQDIVSSMTEAERLRLMELLTVANRRLDGERLALDRCQDQLRQERKKCVRLETKLSRLERERVGCSKATGYGKPLPKTSSHSAELETLKDKAELLEEKCLALETRMSCLRQEREEDSRRYMNLIEETRNKFLEHLKKSNLTQKDIKASVSRIPERRSHSTGNGSIDPYPDDFPID
ncbi:hypothetical protein AAG570_005968 [Ranatra chinensis]|uniref:Uncharacterized protein n=1 Tax=Ranatra chinensis TaxID=642074 RepID=A0ABD0YBQ6_9HEMI